MKKTTIFWYVLLTLFLSLYTYLGIGAYKQYQADKYKQ